MTATSGARRSTGASGSRSTATRQALLDAAVDALREVGFTGASAREIGRRAGSTQSQVFYHYTSVVDLLLAALDEISERRLATYQPLLEAAQTPADLVRALKAVIESDLTHSVVAGVLGLEMLASLGERDRTAHLLSEASNLVDLLASEQEGESS